MENDMAKYASGTYVLHGFDKYGTKQWSKISENQSLMGAVAIGKREQEAGKCDSFAVSRALYNSIDSQDWGMPSQ